MTTQENFKDDWLDRAFRLAFFLHGERETAKMIAARAMNKLEIASNAQYKRYYYTPTGRAENAKATRSRVSLDDLQLLQRLVFVESENFEREKEKSRKINHESLLKFFVKHLVRISLKRNSFYVTLAVTRILHNYATADAMEIYNIVVQDPERVHDDYYYRSRKGVLMKELKTRFGNLLEVVRVNRGEERFQTRTPGENLTATATDSLKFFTPWNSRCALPEKFDPLADVIKPFHFDKKDPDEEHRVEVNRIHAALHPCCFDRLANALRLPPPVKKMEIPKFMLTDNNADFDDQNWRNPPHLDADELRQIKEILTAQAESRKALTAGFLRVVADGVEQARINLLETGAVDFELGDEAELIEVRVVEKTGETVLATHLLSFEDLALGAQTQSVVLEGGQKVSFNLTPNTDEYGEISGLNCGVKYDETEWLKRSALALRRGRFAFANHFGPAAWALKPAFTLGLILLLLTLGWFVFRNSAERESEYVQVPPPVIQNSEIKIPENSPPEDNREQLANSNVPNNLKQPGQPAPGRFEKRETINNRETPPKRKTPVLPETEPVIGPPANELAKNNKRRIEEERSDENGILRLPVRENGGNYPDRKIDRTRKIGVKPKYSTANRGKAFEEIKIIYIELSGDRILGQKIGEQIAAEVQTAGAFTVTNDREQADAALKIYIRHESDGDAPEDASVAAIVRLVNAEGFVVYPNLKRISGWKYVGTTAKLPSRVAQDLIKAARKRGQK